ncbi:MAG: iron-sulfur cluster assembly scaffold protein [bacterium]|nr:iron-sulfur cluster assembly scaffold protein [bacterium]
MKNSLLKDHFLNPRNMGEIAEPTHKSIVKSETCNDIVKMMVIINSSGCIEDIKAQVFGCGYSIAGASFITETIKGKQAEDAASLIEESIPGVIENIPERHIYCVNLAGKAYKAILKTYKTGEAGHGTA